MLFKKKCDLNVYSPISGTYMKLEEVKDTTFSSGLMGKGFGVYPCEDIVKSPMDAEIMMVFPTNHAIGLKRKDGLEMLIHIGIETVNLNGKGFDVLKKVHDKVKKGDELVRFDKQSILTENLEPTVIIIVTNSGDYDLSLQENLEDINSGDVVAYAEKKQL